MVAVFRGKITNCFTVQILMDLAVTVQSRLELTMNLLCLRMLRQLTAEDEIFLTENATATLSQFEKVTPSLGEN